MNQPVRKIVVAGRSALAWIAASGLMRALRHRNLEVWVVDTGVDESPVGHWTLPSQRGMHALLNINEADFMVRTGATFRLATRHVGWQGDGSAFLHAHGDIGSEIGGTPFYRYLQGEARAGRPVHPEAYSLAGFAALLGRFARPMGKDLTASFTYGFHVEANAYATYLRLHAERLGVRKAPAGLANVRMAPGGEIAALQLSDGSELVADLYIDCSGSAGRLATQALPAPREDWSAWLPCDRILSVLGMEIPDPAAITQTVAGDAGWSWRSPFSKASMAGVVYCSAFQSDESARATLAKIEPNMLAEPLLTRIAAGRRRVCWQHNCVALGSAALELEPLAGATLHYGQVGLATLVELFPLNRESTVEAAEFNRLMAEQGDALRDFTLAHYRAGRGRTGEFWNGLRSVPLPARLAHKLDLYAASGRIQMLDHETFEETDWAWLLMGSGCVPAATELQIKDQLTRLSPRDLDAMRAQVHQVAATMPPHAEFVRRQASAPPRPR